ncbi:MAG TPA: hypothetical protein VJ549_09730 [Geothrix sp.]|nr:hypothetical protein [Geothrix sp.]
MTSRVLTGLLASLLLLVSGCKEPDGTSGGTSGVALYTFDSTTSEVFVWKDLNTVYDSATAPAPSYQITSSLFSKVTSLAWGGLAFDSQRGILYLVSDSGSIVRVSNIRAQSGSVPNGEVVSFSLSSTGRLTNGKFGQISVDTSNDTLYISENGDSATQIWVVPGASTQIQDASVTLQALATSGDMGGTGVAAASGSVYAFFKDGGTVGIDALTGPRLRKGAASGFNPTQVILGDQTTLGIYGALAFDYGNGNLYVARHNTDASSTAPPVQVFTTGMFGSTYNVAPYKTLGSATSQADLRVLAHPGTKDWLVGLGTTASSTIYIWKSPLGGTDAKVVVISPTASVFKGIAVDGNAS